MSAALNLEPGSAARADLRRRQPAFGGGGFRCRAWTQGVAVSAARRRQPCRFRARGRINGCISGKAGNSSGLRAPPAAATWCSSDRWCARPCGRSGRIVKVLMLMPRIAAAFRGGDDHLLSGIARLFEREGFRLLGAHEVAPEILVPEGTLGRVPASERDRADIALGFDYLRATGGFDVGQAVVVAGKHVLAVEAAEGTDDMLARVAQMRANGRVRAPAGTGVLVKAPKPGQDQRFDLPSIGPQTVEGVARARLAGIAVVAGSTIIAKPERLISAADHANIFVIGAPAGTAAMSRAAAPHVFLVAGEDSGDRLGAALIAAIKRRSPDARFSGVGGAQMARPWRAKSVSARRSCDHRLCRHPGGPAENHQTHSGHCRRRHRRQAGRAGHHRQPGIHPSRGAARARARAGDPDRRLCVSVGVGVAAGPRARDALIRGSRAGAVAVRAGGDAAAGRAAVHLRRSSAERTGRTPASERRGGAPAACRSAAAAGAAGQPRQRNPPHGGRIRRSRGAGGASVPVRWRWWCPRCRGLPTW